MLCNLLQNESAEHLQLDYLADLFTSAAERAFPRQDRGARGRAGGGAPRVAEPGGVVALPAAGPE